MSLNVEFIIILKLYILKLNAPLVFNEVDMFDFIHRLLDVFLLGAHSNLLFGLFVVDLLHVVEHFAVGRVLQFCVFKSIFYKCHFPL